MIVDILLPACKVTFAFGTEIIILLCQVQLLPNNVVSFQATWGLGCMQAVNIL